MWSIFCRFCRAWSSATFVTPATPRAYLACVTAASTAYSSVNPGRHEPGSGEINYAFLLAHLDRIGYRGWIGCEYRPKGDTVAGLGWAKKYGIG